jgi:putative NADH-flavin reductase
MEARKKVLLIGANGLVGSYLLQYLLEKFQVTALVKHPLNKEIKSQYLTVKQGDVMKDEVLD